MFSSCPSVRPSVCPSVRSLLVNSIFFDEKLIIDEIGERYPQIPITAGTVDMLPRKQRSLI